MLATVWLDILFAPLLAAGVESFDTVPGTSGGYGNAIIHADYALPGRRAGPGGSVRLVAARPWGRQAGVVLGAVVFFHWLLDLIVHRADLPILPGNAGDLPRLGFGLWKVPAASILVELALVVGRLALLASRRPDFTSRHQTAETCSGSSCWAPASSPWRWTHSSPSRTNRVKRSARTSLGALLARSSCPSGVQ